MQRVRLSKNGTHSHGGMKSEPSGQICPTCHKLMPVAQLAQLNHTLHQLLEAGYVGKRRAELIEITVEEIVRVSKHISEPQRGIDRVPENITVQA